MFTASMYGTAAAAKRAEDEYYEQRARELLAAEYEAQKGQQEAADIRTGNIDWWDKAAIRAITAALRAAGQRDSAEQPSVNHGESEDRYVADGRDLNCPACGGSGHVDDIRDLADMLDPAKAADVLRRKIDALPSAPEPVTAAFASACRDRSFVEWAVHRHFAIEPRDPTPDMLEAAPPPPRGDDAPRESDAWRCSFCGELLDESDSAWRWNGVVWQHHHADSGHVDAVDFGPTTAPREAAQQRDCRSLL